MKKLFSKLMLIGLGTMTFVACEDVPEPYPVPQPTPEEEITYSGQGTLESPYTCADVILYAQSLDGEESENTVYIKGIVASVTEEFSTQYGNGTFTISDDGSTANVFTAYRVLYLGNQKFSSGKTQIKQGDEVILCGRVVNYRGNTPETVQGSSYLYSLNGVTEGGGSEQPVGEVKGSGTLDDPYNASAAIKLAQETGEGESADVYIKGKVASITEQYGTQYGNATFAISDDGTTASTTFTIYRALYLGNQKYTSGDLLKQGDEVVIYGKVTNYRGNTPETASGKAFLYSLNGKTEGGNTPAETKVVGSIDEPVTVAAAYEVVEKLEDNATTAEYYYVKGIVTSIKTSESDIAKYKNIDYYIADEQGSNYQLQVFRGKNLGNTDFTSADQLKVGDEVIVYGQLMKYVNNSGEKTPEMAQGSYLVKLNGSTEGGGDTPQSSEVGEIDGNTITAALSAWGLENAADLTTLALKDGTTLTFDKNGGNNGPKYYTAGNAARMYVSNTLNINAGSKTITKVVLNAYADNNATYTAEGNVSGKAEGNTITPELSNTTFTFSGFSSSSLLISNDATGTGSSKQLRIVSIAITYAE